MTTIQKILSKERQETPMPATFADRYLVERAASTGTASFVWRAKDLSSSAPVALKFFSEHWVRNPAAFGAAQQVVARLQRVQHPGLITAQEVVVGTKYAAFVTPWIEGPSLRQMMYARPTRFFEVEDFRRWLSGLLHVLEAAHAHGLVHGALDPDVVLQNGGDIYVVGSGINAWIHDAARRHGVRAVYKSPPAGMSPSRLRGEPPRASDDIYAVGALIYEMLVGAPPRRGRWGGLSSRPLEMARQRRRNGDRGDAIPIPWERTVLRCLEPRERDRPGSARELRLRLDLPEPVKAWRKSPAVAPPPQSSSAAESPPSSAPSQHSSPPESPPPARQSPPPQPAASPPPRPQPAASPPPRPPAATGRPAPPGPAAVHAKAPRVSRLPEPQTAAGVFWLRVLFVAVVLATIGVAGWLAWKVSEQRAQTREASTTPVDQPPAATPDSRPTSTVDQPSADTTQAKEAMETPPAPIAEATTEPPAEVTTPTKPPPPAESAASSSEEPAPSAPSADETTSATPTETSPPPPPPAPATGSIDVQSEPAGAAVRIGDRPADHTPFHVDDLAPGQYPVLVTHPGYAPFQTSVTVTADGVSHVEAPLQRLTGRLHVASNPAGVGFVARSVSNEGEPREGVTPAELQLPTGRYVVVFHRDGFTPRTLVVDVNDRRVASANTTFPKPEPAVVPAAVAAASLPPEKAPGSTPALENDVARAIAEDTARQAARAVTSPVAAATGAEAAAAPHAALALHPPPPALGASVATTANPVPESGTSPLPSRVVPTSQAPTLQPSEVQPAQTPASARPAPATPPPGGESPEMGSIERAPTPEVAESAAPPPAAALPDHGIYEMSDVDVAPRLLQRVDPEVRNLRFRRGNARVEIVVVIDRTGRVAVARVHSATVRSLIEPSLQAVRSWRFSPAQKDGRNVSVRVLLPLVFSNP